MRFAPLGALAALAATAQPDQDASRPIGDTASAPAEMQAPVPGLPLPLGTAGLAEPEAADEVSDDDIETFAEIYVALERVARRYERAIAEADSEREAQEIQTRLQTDSLAILERHGWTPEKFNRVARILNARPDLAADALRRIDEER